MLFRVFFVASFVGIVCAAGCDGGGFAADAGPPDAPATGTVTLAWSITDLNNVPLVCEQVGATTVFLQLRSRTGGNGATVSLGCTSGIGTSQSVTPGLYDVTFELHAGADTIAIATAQTNINIRPGLDTQLTSVTFKLDSNGRLELSIGAPPGTTNCRSTSEGGAGITTNTITLNHTGDGCAPVTFTRSRAGTAVGTYTVDCSTPVVTDCIESDELLTVDRMESGPYTILIRGNVGALTCWQNNDSFQVPPLGKTLAGRRNLGFQASIMGCVRP